MSIFAYKEKDGTMNVLCAGKVTRDPEIKQTNNGSRVKFSISYGKKKFMECEAWGDSDVGSVAGCLEKGDNIAVTGTHRSWEYNGKQYASLTVDMIFTLAAPLPLSPASEEDLPPSSTTYQEMMDEADGEIPF